jgi:uracil-DNA glycosylase family 4
MTSSPNRRAVFLHEIGVGPLWTRRVDSEPASDSTEATPASFEAGELAGAAPAAAQIANMDWIQLKEAVSGCVKCDLCRTRTRTVFGVGDDKANWLFVGEGPGYNENLKGEPFVGQAGKLLDNMLLAMDLKRGENAYIANIVKCRPTDATGRDRAPAPEEIAACMPYLRRQIELIRPAIIVALGKTAALSLLNLEPDTSVSRIRGKVHRYAELPLVVTYHPAYLLRNPADKKKVWMDLCLAMATYAASN